MAFEHEADHGEADEGCDGGRIAFEVAGEAAVAADPCETALDDPALWQDDESVAVGSLDDFDLPAACGGDRPGHFRPLISCVGEYPFDERKAPPRPRQKIVRAVAILNVGGQNAHAKQEAERVDEDVALAAGDLLARVKALRVERRPPF